MVDTWTSDAKEAHVIKRLVVGETYTLREEFAPYGYLKATDIQFTVEDKVQHVEMKDEVPTGSIVINKDGEFVTDTTLMKGHWYDFIFNYFKDSLAGVMSIPDMILESLYMWTMKVWKKTQAITMTSWLSIWSSMVSEILQQS